MNKTEAIETHRIALLRIIAGLFAFMEWVPGLEKAPAERLTRPIYYAVHRLLLPAESALRRLIFVVAQGIVVKPCQSRAGRSSAKKENTGAPVDSEKTLKKRRRLFRLFDTFKRRPPSKPVRDISPEPEPRLWPRIHVYPYDTFPSHVPPPVIDLTPEPRPKGDGLVSATPLYNRLVAFIGAVEDLNAQAKRLANWLAKPVEERKPARESPLRYDCVPGLPSDSTHEVHHILLACNALVDDVRLEAFAKKHYNTS